MRGAIIGDVAGSPYEGWAEGPAGDFLLFCPRTRFTDDSVCTAAVADAILNDRDFGEALRDWAARYPDAGYAEMFALWARGHIKEPYGSFGNGAPMRVSPCAWLAPSEERSLYLAARSCAPTHNHPDSVAAACAVVSAIWAGRRGAEISVLRRIATQTLGQLPPELKEFKQGVGRSIEAIPTVLRAMSAALAAVDFEDAIRIAIRGGGDTDTIAAIAGSIAEGFFPIPEALWVQARELLPEDIRAVVSQAGSCVSSSHVQEL
jgi:ADP-ribosylglycohydrolase